LNVYLLPLLSGALLALSFPRFGYPAFAWLSLTPLLLALFGKGDRDIFQPGPARNLHSRSSQKNIPVPFFLGLLTGLGYFAGTVYWTGGTVRTFGGLSWPVAALVAALLVCYLALFPALFAGVLGLLRARFGLRAIMLAPAVWVATELARAHFWSGFPWVLLGYSQTTALPVAQFASLFGVYGLSGLVALASTAAAFVTVVRSRASLATLAATVLILAVVTVWGAGRVNASDLTTQGSALRVALVQGNIPQNEKWDPAHANRILNTYLQMTREAAARGGRFVVWPESSTPFYFEEDALGGEQIRAVVRETGIDLLLGSDQIVRDPPGFYNAAFLVRRDGATAAVYRKIRLVPFGEYVPLQSLLFFVAPLVESVGDFSPGESTVMLPLGDSQVSTAICYEIVYPNLVRDAVRAGSQLLTTITNDAWYGRSSAPYQHFEQASMRAIEEGRYLVRAANTGISGIVDPYGRVLQKSGLFERSVLVGDVRLLDALTVYGRIGDAFAYVCAALTLAAVFTAARAGRRKR
jgi:apolipoprotein N-acyltransferase